MRRQFFSWSMSRSFFVANVPWSKKSKAEIEELAADGGRYTSVFSALERSTGSFLATTIAWPAGTSPWTTTGFAFSLFIFHVDLHVGVGGGSWSLIHFALGCCALGVSNERW